MERGVKVGVRMIRFTNLFEAVSFRPDRNHSIGGEMIRYFMVGRRATE